MHVAVVGAGALGRAYGVLLASRAGVRVSFVVRERRVDERSPMIVERVRRDEREVLASPVRVASVPDDADVVLLAVHTDDLGETHEALVRAEAPVVVLTPTMPSSWDRLARDLGARAVAAMPSLVAYVREDDVVRLWLPPRPTLVSEPPARFAGPIADLVDAGARAGLTFRRTLEVHRINSASTVSLIGVGMAIAAAGSLDALLADAELRELAARTCHDGAQLGERLGAADPGARLAAVLLTGGLLRAGFTLLRRVSPEAAHYAEAHFGTKLLAQHRQMIAEMAELARAQGTPYEAFEEMAVRLATAP